MASLRRTSNQHRGDTQINNNWPDSATFWRNKRVVVTGVRLPYKEPEAAELVIESDLVSAEEAVEAILAELAARGMIGS